MEVIAPKRGGSSGREKATVVMTIEVLIEVDKSDSFYDMEEQAKEKLQRHVVEGKGFFPFRSHCETVHEVPLDTMIQNTTINPKRGW